MPYILRWSYVWCTYIYNVIYSSWVDTVTIMLCPSLSLVMVFILKCVLFDMNIATPVFFWFLFAWDFFFQPLTFSLYASLSLKWGSYRQHAAAAAKLRQSCPTLCDPIDSSPPGSPIPGILYMSLIFLFIQPVYDLLLQHLIYLYLKYLLIYMILLTLYCCGLVFVNLFFLLCYLSREVSLTFVVKLFWWSWILFCLSVKFWFFH